MFIFLVLCLENDSMKKLSMLMIIFLSSFFYSQTQDLYALAKGEYLGFNAIFDQKDNLFGYVSIYSYGKSSDKTKKFEYVILDKNLNPVANKEFEGDITAGSYFGYMDFRGEIILRPSRIDREFVTNKTIFTPSSMIIDLKDNSIKKKIYYDYDNGNFKEITEPKSWKTARKENREEKKEKGFNYISYVVEIKEGGYIAVEYNDYGNYVNNNSLIKFDENKKELWRYRYNTSGNKKLNEEISLIDKDEKHLFFLVKKTENKNKQYSLLVLDIKTGEKISNKKIDVLNNETLDYITNLYSYSFGNIDNDKIFDDKIVMLGNHITNDFRKIGYTRFLVDKNSYETDIKDLDHLDLVGYIPKIKEMGMVESGYYLEPRDVFFLKDGSVGLLLEKYKPEGPYSAPKTTDLVYVFTDKDFKTKGVKIFEKEKSRWSNSDYLFSQYLNDGKDVVFFYRDYVKDSETKEKNWNLYINTLIDGNFKQEVVPISAKDDYMVYPYVGKEGYILLREYNQKEKYNKIRLERLNY
ncbi:MAG: hypothetical protein DI529_01015 [Chryseobacterium sp.]|nr:MAG: hypothetical protein DI529_01015 [Chryseobacterium sp.]